MTVAWKRVIAFQIEQLVEKQKLSKMTMAEQMQTSRAITMMSGEICMR